MPIFFRFRSIYWLRCAEALNNLAGLYESRGDYEKALTLLERAVGISKNKLGYNHPSIKVIENKILEKLMN